MVKPLPDHYSGPKVFFKTCVAMKFVDDDDDRWPHMLWKIVQF